MRIVGSGVAGILLARALAEQGKIVDVYEREPRVGGVLNSIGKIKLYLADTACYNWFTQRSSIIRLSSGSPFFAPQCSLQAWCEELLCHQRIRVTTNAPIVLPESLLQSQHTIFCGDLDRFFGYRYGFLPYDKHGMPILCRETAYIHHCYCALAAHYNMRFFGMRPCHEALWVHQLWEKALRVVGAST